MRGLRFNSHGGWMNKRMKGYRWPHHAASESLPLAPSQHQINIMPELWYFSPRRSLSVRCFQEMDHFAWSFLKLGCWSRRQLSFLQHCRGADSLSPGPQKRQKAAVALGHSFLKIKNVTWAELRGLTPPLCLCLVCPLTDERWAIPRGVGGELGQEVYLART